MLINYIWAGVPQPAHKILSGKEIVMHYNGEPITLSPTGKSYYFLGGRYKNKGGYFTYKNPWTNQKVTIYPKER